MKKLLLLLFSLFFLSSPSVFADDISDFSIGGISFGDSLLDYMSEDEILKEIELSISLNGYSFLNEPNKYIEVYIFGKDFPTYDVVSVFIKNNFTNQYVTNNNEKYRILSIWGSIDFIEDFNACMKKRDEIAADLSKMFPNAIKDVYGRSHRADPSGDSKFEAINFNLSLGGYIEAQCDNFEETFRIKNNYSEGLNVAIISEEIENWFND